MISFLVHCILLYVKCELGVHCYKLANASLEYIVTNLLTTTVCFFIKNSGLCI